MSDPPLVFSEVVKRKLILPKKARYTVADVRSVLTESLLRPVNRRTLSIAEAVFVVNARRQLTPRIAEAFPEKKGAEHVRAR